MERLPSPLETPEEVNLLGHMMLYHALRDQLPHNYDTTVVHYPDESLDYHVVPTERGRGNTAIRESYLHYTNEVCNIRVWRMALREARHDTSRLVQSSDAEHVAPSAVLTINADDMSKIDIRPLLPNTTQKVHYSHFKTQYSFFTPDERTVATVRTDHYLNVFEPRLARGTAPATAQELTHLHTGITANVPCSCRWSAERTLAL